MSGEWAGHAATSADLAAARARIEALEAENAALWNEIERRLAVAASGDSRADQTAEGVLADLLALRPSRPAPTEEP